MKFIRLTAAELAFAALQPYPADLMVASVRVNYATNNDEQLVCPVG